MSGVTVNTNVPSLLAQRFSNDASALVSQNIQRLATGKRIIKAADDAAGFAIVQNLNAQQRGLSAGRENLATASALIGTANSGLSSIKQSVLRGLELAVKSASDTTSAGSRTSLQSEFSSLNTEANRIATETNFNGVSLLDGTFSAADVQIGLSSKITLSSISSLKTSDLGSVFSATVNGGGAVTSAALTGASGFLTIDGVDVGASTSGSGAGQSADSAFAKAAAINAAGITNVTATATSTTVTSGAAANNAEANIAEGDLIINGVSIGAIANNAADLDAQAVLVVNAINLKSAETGVVAVANGNRVDLTAADGRNIDVDATTEGTALTGFSDGVARGNVNITKTDPTSSGTLTLAGASGLAAINHSAASTTLTSGGTTVNLLDISTKSGATTAISALRSALDQIVSVESNLGVTESTIAFTDSLLSAQAQSQTEAIGSIEDVDFASAVGELSKGQILLQASRSVISTANSLPQGFLSLLQ